MGNCFHDDNYKKIINHTIYLAWSNVDVKFDYYYHRKIINSYAWYYQDLSCLFYAINEHEMDLIIENIQKNNTIKHLDLSNINLTDDLFIRFLTKIKKTNPTLRKISLKNNKISDISLFPLCVFLQKNQHIQEIEIAGNLEISKNGISILKNFLSFSENKKVFFNFTK